MNDEERTKQLLTMLADHLAYAERCVRQLIAVMTPKAATQEISCKAQQSDDSSLSVSTPGSDVNIGLNPQQDAFSGISGNTLTVDEPILIKKWSDGKELWGQPIVPGSSICVCADNRYMLSHPSDATEELMERLQEDHGV